jgi:murein DD-endopeptidase MepM/ murein hydrolase activator NlpD
VSAGAPAPAAIDRRQVSINRSALRPALGAAAVDQRANLRADSMVTASQLIERTARAKAADARAKSLKAAADRAEKKAQQVKKAQKRAQLKKAEQKAERAKRAKAAAAREKAQERAVAKAKDAAAKAAKVKSSAAAKDRSSAAAQDRTGTGHASLPVTSGFHIAARFGDTGSWSRYHTGIDFAAPMHTPIHAAAAGVVTHAGSGSAGWAGHYVAIRHADGKSTLYAHMSTVSVHVGEHVSGGQRIGAIGMTGRSFGPHVHFELYPSGVKPGNLYHAINPAPWLHAKGLHY